MTDRWLRPAPMRDVDAGERTSTWLELFFDLCFVAAVAALANGLHADPSLDGLWHFSLLFVPVWWAWMEFTWFATAWDNDDLFHRLTILAAMLLVIVLAAGIPDVLHGTDDRQFVLAYAAMQGLLIVMFLRVWPHAGDAHRFVRNYMIGDAIGGLLMLASLAVDPPLRYWVWAVAVLELMAVPVFAVRAYRGQPFDSNHIPERYGLFTIIVLGEGVVAVTAGLGEVSFDGGSVASALMGFGIAAAIWWAYFETVSSSALSRERVAASFLWGYGHLFAYAGIAATAVGVELAIAAGAHADHGRRSARSPERKRPRPLARDATDALCRPGRGAPRTGRDPSGEHPGMGRCDDGTARRDRGAARRVGHRPRLPPGRPDRRRVRRTRRDGRPRRPTCRWRRPGRRRSPRRRATRGALT